MCNFIYKRFTIAVLSVLFLLCLSGAYGFSRYHPCEIEGVNIAGLTQEVARQKIERELQRQLKAKKLTIQVENKRYCFCYPQLYYKTNLIEVLQQAQSKKGKLRLQKELCLTNLEKSLRGICDDFYRQSIDASIVFHGRTTAKPVFQYTRDRAGRFLDGKKLRQDVENALQRNFKKEMLIYAKAIYKDANFQVNDAKNATKLLASFCTYFATSNAERTHNITLASEYINGTVLEPNMVFSFNEKTGPRTVERGFKEAHIIQEGEFVNGVGGGVCQVSTTVYNCALLAGLKIVEYHPHSLQVGYVPPSFDAMVNGRVCDLKFRNCYDTPVYIASRVQDNQLRVEVYGMPTGVVYSRESVLLEKIAPKEPEICIGEEEKVLRPEKEGVRSEGYLIIEKNGRIERKKIRTDYYKSVQGKVQILPKVEEDEKRIEDIERDLQEEFKKLYEDN